MTDSPGRPADIGTDNPLRADPVLFGMYMGALDAVLGRPEIRQACDEFTLSPARLRMIIASGAARVLEAAPPEFEAYRRAVEQQRAAAELSPLEVTRGTPGWSLNRLMRLMLGIAIVSVLVIIGGAASSAAWAPMAALAQAGATVLVVSALAFVGLRFLSGGDMFLRSLGFVRPGSMGLDITRLQLMAAVSDTELLAQVRTLINHARQDRFGYQYSVVGAPGLSEVYDSTNQVPTRAAAEMDDLLGRFDGASIGVAGPRGSGKSTLVRQYCDEIRDVDNGFENDSLELSRLLGTNLPRPRQTDLRCFVAAPVDYVARDFVLHLFATFCRAVIGRYSVRNYHLPRLIVVAFWLRRAWRLLLSLLWRAVVCGAAVFALVHWKHSIARSLSVPVTWVEYTVIAVICLGALDFAMSAAIRIRRWARQVRGQEEHPLATTARQHLSRVRYLQTYTSGWSGALQLPWGNSGGQYSRSVAQAEQPHSYPEIIDDFRNFAREMAAEVHLKNNRVFIGIDELDKIGSADQAEHFLNEIKGIFGIPHVYFMVSVSDDALTAFERRGLPLRNAFDSSFDEILPVGPLSYDESRRLLYRRVIGLSEPYVALCHCLAGGLARDVIRAARQVVRAAVAITSADPPPISLEKVEDYDSEAYLLFQSRPKREPPSLGAITAAVIQDELRRKLRAVSNVISTAAPANATDLYDTLYQISQTLTLGQPVIHIVDLMTGASDGEPAELTGPLLDFAAYAYYCATLQEVFTDQLDREHIIAATSVPAGPGSFDALASARATFSVDTLLAWRLITLFRKAWSQETREGGQAAAAVATSFGQPGLDLHAGQKKTAAATVSALPAGERHGQADADHGEASGPADQLEAPR